MSTGVMLYNCKSKCLFFFFIKKYVGILIPYYNIVNLNVLSIFLSGIKTPHSPPSRTILSP